MSSTSAPDGISPCPTNLVEVVSSARGALEAKYDGKTFKLRCTKGTRYYWRCSLRLSRRLGYLWDPEWKGGLCDHSLECKSRLTTDLHGDQHLLYSYVPHNEDLHQLCAERKWHPEASDKQQGWPRRGGQATSSTSAPERISPAPATLVEVVSSARGGLKAKCAGRMFKLHCTKGKRYYWRCDLRPPRRLGYRWDPDRQAGRGDNLHACKARLTTDLHGYRHLVYRHVRHNEALHRFAQRRRPAQPPDEDRHQRAERKRKTRLSEIRKKQQHRRLIGGFRYVVERYDGPFQIWRCVIPECTARCRTHFFSLIVDAPSRHLEDVHAQMDDPLTENNCSNGFRTLPRQLEQQGNLREDVEAQWSPSASASASANDVSDITASSGGRKRCRPAAPFAQVTDAPPPDPAPSSGATSDSPGRNQASLTQNQKETNGAVHDGDHPDGPGQYHSDHETAEHRRDNGSLDIQLVCQDAADNNSNPAAENVSRHAGDTDMECLRVGGDHEGCSAAEADAWWRYRGAASLLHDQVYGAHSSLYALCEEVLQLTCDVGDIRDSNLRASILLHMHRLLQAETNLVEQKRRVEAMRGKVLRHKLGDLLSRTEPAPLNS